MLASESHCYPIPGWWSAIVSCDLKTKMLYWSSLFLSSFNIGLYCAIFLYFCTIFKLHFWGHYCLYVQSFKICKCLQIFFFKISPLNLEGLEGQPSSTHLGLQHTCELTPHWVTRLSKVILGILYQFVSKKG